MDLIKKLWLWFIRVTMPRNCFFLLINPNSQTSKSDLESYSLLKFKVGNVIWGCNHARKARIPKSWNMKFSKFFGYYSFYDNNGSLRATYHFYQKEESSFTAEFDNDYYYVRHDFFKRINYSMSYLRSTTNYEFWKISIFDEQSSSKIMSSTIRQLNMVFGISARSMVHDSLVKQLELCFPEYDSITAYWDKSIKELRDMYPKKV